MQRLLACGGIALLTSFVVLQGCGDDEAATTSTTPDAAAPGSDGGDPVTDSGVAPDAATTIDAAPPGDNGNDQPLGAGPLVVAYAGKTVGSYNHKVKTFNFAGANLNAFTRDGEPALSFDHGTTTTTGTLTADGAAIVGQWQNGTAMGSTAFDWPATGGAVYVVAKAAGTVPTTGTIDLVPSKVTPVIVGDGSAGPGTLTGTASMIYKADNTVRIGFDLTVKVGTDTFTLSSLGGTANPDTSETRTENIEPNPWGFGAFFAELASANPLCADAPGNGKCTASVQGFVVGPAGDHLALVVHVFNGFGGVPKSLSAAAYFSKP